MGISYPVGPVCPGVHSLRVRPARPAAPLFRRPDSQAHAGLCPTRPRPPRIAGGVELRRLNLPRMWEIGIRRYGPMRRRSHHSINIDPAFISWNEHLSISHHRWTEFGEFKVVPGYMGA